MFTKTSPGPDKFDCYKAAKPNEPMFVLLARDKLAPLLVEMWAVLSSKRGIALVVSMIFLFARMAQHRERKAVEKIENAFDCANSMRIWHCLTCGGATDTR